jgi:DNA polymerase-3 subunit epsilon
MYAIVDIETTGGSHQNDKITEIAIYIHDGNRIVDEFCSLVNPERSIPYFITGLTGITNEMVADAPKFYEIAKEIVKLTENKIFVAHNAGFDYNFIRNEFKNLGYDYKRQQLCTVKLSRKIIPGLKSYSLGNICNDLNIIINDRHRAAGDAFATVRLLEKLLHLDELAGNGDITLSTPKLHPSLKKETIENLPQAPGVYYLHDETGKIIYIGKSKNIHARVLSHLSNQATKRAGEMRDRIAGISYELTGNELVALLLESHEIKLHKPLYNRRQRRSMFTYGLFTYKDENNYTRFMLDKSENRVEQPLTTFNNKKAAVAFINKMVEKYRLCQKLSGIYNSQGSCFHYSIMECNGACDGKEHPEIYNIRAREALENFKFIHDNFLIIDKGRDINEKTVIKIKNGKYMGFGYIEKDTSIMDETNLDDYLKPLYDNRDVQMIIKNYLKKNKVEKIIKL